MTDPELLKYAPTIIAVVGPILGVGIAFGLQKAGTVTDAKCNDAQARCKSDISKKLDRINERITKADEKHEKTREHLTSIMSSIGRIEGKLDI